jgi:predicted DCC family thiol-disulfide oxidoreductase YuxK
MEPLRIIYNDTCPICSREVGGYRRAAADAGAPVAFDGLDAPDLAELGLTRDTAARRFHAVRDGRLLSGVDAFAALWAELPRWRWLARVVTLPGIRTVAGLAYDHAAAPMLYALHRRREARR